MGNDEANLLAFGTNAPPFFKLACLTFSVESRRFFILAKNVRMQCKMV